MAEDLRALDVPVHILPTLVRDPSPLRDLAAVASLAAGFRDLRPSLVHTHTSKAGLLGALAARLAGVPAVVYTSQGHIFAGAGAIPGVTGRTVLRPLFLGLRRAAEAMSDRVIALTEADLKEQLALGLAPREKYAVIPNGVDPSPFLDPSLPDRAGARGALGLPVEGTLVACVARLSPEKGQDVLLEALSGLPGLKALFVGDGPRRAELERRASGQAVFLGLRKDVPLCLRAADLFVLPSRYEAQGMALVEGMMAGLPVVASRVGGVPSLVEDGRTGLLVPPGDPAALAAAIRSLLENPESTNGMAGRGRRFALDHLGTDAMVERYLKLYVELS